MANLFNNPGYSVVETNHINSIRTGEIKAQFPCVGSDWLENGMLAQVFEVEKVIRKPLDSFAYCYLHASEERIYQPHLGRASWILNCKTQIPKMLKLNKGDLFETDAVVKGTIANVQAVKDAIEGGDAIYGLPHISGYIQLLTDVEAGVLNIFDTCSTILQVVDVVSLPNEREGIKFVVLTSDPVAFLAAGRIFLAFGFKAADNLELAEDVEGVFQPDHTITLTVPFGTDVNALVADFDTSSEATVLIGDIEQVSGTTENDFTEAVEYKVVAENGLSTTYTVIVEIAEEE